MPEMKDGRSQVSTGMWGPRTLFCQWWEYKLTQSLSETVWESFTEAEQATWVCTVT